MSFTALLTLVRSSKASVLVAALVFVGVLVYRGQLTPEQIEVALKWSLGLIGTWMIAHAGEKGAKAIARGNGSIVAPIKFDIRNDRDIADVIKKDIRQRVEKGLKEVTGGE